MKLVKGSNIWTEIGSYIFQYCLCSHCRAWSPAQLPCGEGGISLQKRCQFIIALHRQLHSLKDHFRRYSYQETSPLYNSSPQSDTEHSGLMDAFSLTHWQINKCGLKPISHLPLQLFTVVLYIRPSLFLYKYLNVFYM